MVKVGVGVGVRVGYGVRASDPQPELLSVGYGELHLDVGAMVLVGEGRVHLQPQLLLVVGHGGDRRRDTEGDLALVPDEGQGWGQG